MALEVSRIQVVKASMVLTARNFFADPQWVIPSIIAPFVFTLVALFLFSNVTGPILLYAVLGGGMMGMWGTTVYGSGESISFDRWNGTMECTLSAPSPLIWIVLGRVIWNTLEGSINAIFILFIGFLWFRVGVSLADPLLFAASTFVTFLSLSAFGTLLANVIVLSRKGGFITNGIEIPVYIATGTMFPIGLLPFYVGAVSYSIGPTWGIDAIRKAAIGSYVGQLPFSIFVDIAVTIIITVVYFAMSSVLMVRVEKIAKRNGTLGDF